MDLKKGGSAKTKILTIFILIIFLSWFLGQLGLIYIKFKKEEILKKWETYKCNPIILPIAGHIKPGIDTGLLQQECFSKFFVSLFNGKILSQMPIFGMIERTLGESNNQMGFFDKFFDDIGTFFEAATTTMYEKIQNLLQVVIFTFLKIKNILGRIQAAMRLQLYALDTIKMTMTSIWDGPIGEGIRDFGEIYDSADDFFNNIWGKKKGKVEDKDEEIKNEGCFSEDTLIDGIRIKDLCIGSQYKNNYILGMVIMKNTAPLYNYNNIKITGSHYVKDNNQYKFISNTDAIQDKINIDNLVYCPITDNQKIMIDTIEFLDYMECNNNYYLNHLLSLLNNQHIIFKNNSRFMGFHPNTLINYPNGLYKPLHECSIGDILENDIEIIAIVKVVAKQTKCYHYNNTIISGRQIIHHCNKWINIESLVTDPVPTATDDVLYSLITNTNIIPTKHFIARDFEELNDTNMKQFITKMIN